MSSESPHPPAAATYTRFPTASLVAASAAASHAAHSAPLSSSSAAAVASGPHLPSAARSLHVHSGPPASQPSSVGGSLAGQDLSPLSWEAFFDVRRFVSLEPARPAASEGTAGEEEETKSDAAATEQFCVYTAAPPAAPSASSAAASAPPPFLVVLLHGGGQSSLAWGCVSQYLKHGMSLMAFDLRGHGSSRSADDLDLSMARLVDDVVRVVSAVHSRPPPLLLVGHSLGGALAIHVTASKRLPVAGLVVVDLVEGSAVSSMEHMRGVIESRPEVFPTLDDAVAWSLLAGALRNTQSARLSVPDQLVRCEEPPSPEADAPVAGYRWRTDLLSSERHWSGWFSGLSSLFLSCSLPKLLLLASTDRLDPPLMVAHMQGRLQVDVIANAGHCIQEDQPRETARKVAEFVKRHRMDSMGAALAAQAHKTMPVPALTPFIAATTFAAAPAARAEDTPARTATNAKPPVPLFHE